MNNQQLARSIANKIGPANILEAEHCMTRLRIKVNTLKKWESFYRTSGTSTSQVEFFFRESRNQIALKTYR